MWTDPLAGWFVANGRHALPWRRTSDPWAVLVSEVMLQQTSVARVLPRWERFLARWPSPAAIAAAPLADVLREWQGLGYPRRARALWLCGCAVAAEGWPRDEAGLRALPGVGRYTAGALLAFSDLGDAGPPATVPRDVNVTRVTARAALGREPDACAAAELDAAAATARPHDMPMRAYVYALFDIGALLCRPRPRCDACPLRPACAFAARGGAVPARGRRQAPYPGSLRQLRGAVLAHVLEHPAASETALVAATRTLPGASPERVRAALAGLIADGLVGGTDVVARER